MAANTLATPLSNSQPKVFVRQVAAGDIPLAPADVVTLLSPSAPGVQVGDRLHIVEDAPGAGNPLQAAQILECTATQVALGGTPMNYWQTLSTGVTADFPTAPVNATI